MNRQEYLLTCLSEEAAEIIQAVGKAQRFGLDDDFFDESPKQAIIRELNDFMAVIELLDEYCDAGFWPWEDAEMIEAKKKKVLKYIEYSEKKGTLK